MAELKSALDAAVKQGIVSSDQGEQLASFFVKQGLEIEPVEMFDELYLPADEPAAEVEESESPRFVRGFHDILITIGITAALVGLWGLLGNIAVMVATVGLAEILILRQRLALPAFCLTLFFAAAAISVMFPFAERLADDRSVALGGLGLFLAQPIVLLPFYWRYRVPVSLAAMILGGFMACFMMVMAAIDVSVAGDVFESQPLLTIVVALVFAVALFAIAMAFDLGDRHRVTRRSDVAFWLHLAAAPALLYTLFAFLLFDGSASIWWARDPGFTEAVIAMVVITIFMLIGILIDRRAFVTSGLISLGVAVAAIAREANIDMSEFVTLPLFAVGLIVLVLGIGWQRLRAIFLGAMPDSLTSLLPPAKSGASA